MKKLTISKPFGGLAVACWLLALVFLLFAFGARVSFDHFQLINTNGASRPVTLPFSEQSNRFSTSFVITGEIHRGWLPSGEITVIPDDRVVEMKINDRQVDLSGIPSQKLEDVTDGFGIDLGDYLHHGTNTIQVRVQDYGGMYAFDIRQGSFGWITSLILAGLLLCLPIAIGTFNFSGISYRRQVLYTLIVAANLLQVWLIFRYNPVDHIWSDPQRHWEQGVDVLRMDLMSMSDPIMFQVYVGVLAKLSLKLPLLVGFYTSLLAVFGHWIWYRFFRELQTSKTLALAGWATVSLLPSWTSIYSYFMQETLLLPLLGAALWSTWRARRKGDVASFVLMVVIWVAAGLTRGIAIPLAAVSCSWLWLAQDNKVRKAIFSSLVLLVALGPLTYRSYQTVHLFAPHGMGHLNSIYSRSGKREIVVHTHKDGARWTHIFGSPSVGAKPFEPFSDWMSQRKGKVEITVDLNKGSEDWKKASEKIDMSFGKYLWITKEGLIMLFFAPSWPDDNPNRLVDIIGKNMRWIWAPAFILAIAGTVVMRRKLRGQMFLPMLILTWFIVQGLLPICVNEGRYRKPLEGFLVAQYMLLAAAAIGATRSASNHIDTQWFRWRRRRAQEGKEEGDNTADTEEEITIGEMALEQPAEGGVAARDGGEPQQAII